MASKTASRRSNPAPRIAVVYSRYNLTITQSMAYAAIETCGERTGFTPAVFEAPGSYELTSLAMAAARSDRFDGIVALGCIIRGETYHFELVAHESGAGVSRVALDFQLPIANAILTTENLAQALARQHDKGRDAARVAVEMANLLDSI